MKISNKKLEKAIVELTVAFESDEWKSTQDKALNKLAKSVKIDGFRPGKAPVALIKSRISKASILQELMLKLNQWLNQLYLLIKLVKMN